MTRELHQAGENALSVALPSYLYLSPLMEVYISHTHTHTRGGVISEPHSSVEAKMSKGAFSAKG